MTRFLQTLAIAIVLVFAITIPLAFADPQCSSGKAHISRIEADLNLMKTEPGWETTQLTYIQKQDTVVKVLQKLVTNLNFMIVYKLRPETLANTTELLWVSTEGKPNAYVLLLDKERCWLADGPVPLGLWKSILSAVEQGA